jgi:hypothetical protein
MIKYLTHSHYLRAEIKAVEVERETDSSVWINGHRMAKETGWDKYHDYWESAKAHLIVMAVFEVENAERKLVKAKKLLMDIQDLNEE